MSIKKKATAKIKKVVASKKVSNAKPKTSKKTSKKTSSKKSTVRKTTAKKSTAKKANAKGKVLVCASGEQCFWTSDGQVLEDLFTLRDALDIMSEDVYSHHVTKEKNDFADWVANVLMDYECAEALRKSRKPNTAKTVVVRYLKYYQV